jgi:hypothetical protein
MTNVNDKSASAPKAPWRRLRPVHLLAGLGLIGLGLTVGWALSPAMALARFGWMSPSAQHHHMVAMRDEMWHEMLPDGDYACCLHKPCSSCAMLDPHHGEGSACTCLDDVMNGRHPCGECVGGIIGGRGNPFLAKYFARSLADGQPGPYYEALKQIVADKYGVAEDEQKPAANPDLPE